VEAAEALKLIVGLGSTEIVTGALEEEQPLPKVDVKT
jgi:hypothetical protein